MVWRKADRPDYGIPGIDSSAVINGPTMSMRSYFLVTTLAFACAIATSSSYCAPAPYNPDPVNGRKLALLICSACHVVGPDQKRPPMLRAPAVLFESLAQKTSTSYEGVRDFITTTHEDATHREAMPNPMLTDDQASDISAYILSLRHQQ